MSLSPLQSCRSQIHIKGKVANGYEYVDATCVPEEIEIAGSARKLASISRLDIPIDVTGLTSDSSDLERDIEVVNYLPDGITIPEEYQKISVKIDVEKKKEKKIKIPFRKLQFRYCRMGHMLPLHRLHPDSLT